MIKYIDLENDYGAVVGSFGAPPPEGYTEQQYEDAYNNKLAIIGAIDDALAEGATEIIFNKTHITLCYEYYSNSGLAGSGETLIQLEGLKDVTIDWGGTTIEMMFDSVNKSPYHTATTRPNAYQLNGKIFGINKFVNVKFKNGIILGDLYYRSFTDTDDTGGLSMERREEQTYAFSIGSIGGGLRFENFKIYGFMGGTIVRGANHTADNNLLTVSAENGFRYFNKGYRDPSTGAVSAKANCYYTDWKTIDMAKNEADNVYFKDMVQINRFAGPNYTFQPNLFEQLVIFADEDYNVIWAGLYGKLNLIPLPPNAKYVSLVMLNEEEDHGEVWDTGVYYHSLVIPSVHDIELENVWHRHCHRGALTNIGSKTRIKHNYFIDNGITSIVFPGKPNFPDTTRYHWNNEEGWNTDVIVEDCFFGRGFNGVLLVSNYVTFRDCTFQDNNGISLNKVNKAKIDNCRFSNFGVSSVNSVSSISIGSVETSLVLKRDIEITSCEFVDVSPFSVDSTSKTTTVRFHDNTVKCINRPINIANTSPNIYYSNNIFEMYARDISNVIGIHLSGLKNFNNNLIINRNSHIGDNQYGLYANIVNVNGYGNHVHNVKIYNRLPVTSIGLFISGVRGFTFENCVFLSPVLNTSSNPLIHKVFADCKFINCKNGIYYGNNTSSWLSKFEFLDCSFVIDESKTLTINGFIESNYSYTNNSERKFEIILKNCSLKNSTEANYRLFAINSSAITPRIEVHNCSANFDLINNVTSGGKV